MRLVVLGDPVDHSLSPALHAAAFTSVGIDGSYGTRRVDETGMVAAVADIRSGALDGANVTMPHKALAASLTDRNAESAGRAGAVNTLVRVGSAVVGHNTDVAGVTYAAAYAELPDAPVLVLGAGGAAAAALLAFEARPLAISARRPERARELVERLGVAAEIVSFGDPMPGAILVNATSVGMAGEELPVRELTVHAGLLDMPYASGPTPATEAMRSAGLPVAEGPDMLIGQAIAAFRLWTGRDPDAEAMRTAIGRQSL